MDEHIVRIRILYVLLLAIAILLGCIVRATPGNLVATNPYSSLPIGYDVSWPNCKATPPKGPIWGIVGVTGGLSLRSSNCLPQEMAWFTSQSSVYINTGYPGQTLALAYSHTPKECTAYDESCIAYDYGYAEGIYAVELATRQNVHAVIWWLDVESDNSWDIIPMVNRASIQGTIDAVRRETVIGRVGIYSYPGQWDVITGDWRPGLPAWVATGEDDLSSAQQGCNESSFTGGPIWLSQYTIGLDRDLVC